MNAASLTLESLERYGAYTAMWFEDRSYTNVERYAYACRLATALREQGVKPGDRVVVMMLNSPEVAAAFTAIWKIGAVIIPVTPMWTAREARYVLADSGAEIVVTSPELAGRLREASEGLPGFRAVLTLGETAEPGVQDLAPAVEAAAPFEPLLDRRGDDLALLLYTSGTTGNPKGVMLSHENLIFIADAVYRLNAHLGQVRGVGRIVAAHDDEQVHRFLEHLLERVLPVLRRPANRVEEPEMPVQFRRTIFRFHRRPQAALMRIWPASAAGIELAPGSVLSRAELAQAYGLSQTPIRDALLRLVLFALAGLLAQEALQQVARLRVGLGDEVLVYTVAYTLENAYELFSVRGLIRAPDPSLERSLALISLADAQALFAYDGKVSEVALLARDSARVAETRAALAAALAQVDAEPLDVNPWWVVMPELEQMLVIDNAQNYSMLGILVLVVAFGLLNTILMSVLERQRELGVMLALGLSPRAIFRLVYVESLLISGVGLALGLALALPAAAYMEGHPIPITGEVQEMSEQFGFEPVIAWKLSAWNPLIAAGLMTAIALLAALYPAVKAASARPVDALRSL